MFADGQESVVVGRPVDIVSTTAAMITAVDRGMFK